MRSDMLFIRVRLEGEVNRFWCITYTDGSIESFSAIEGSPTYDIDDSYVHETNPDLADYLERVAEAGQNEPLWDPDNDVLEFDFNPYTNQLSNMEISVPNGNGGYTTLDLEMVTE